MGLGDLGIKLVEGCLGAVATRSGEGGLEDPMQRFDGLEGAIHERGLLVEEQRRRWCAVSCNIDNLR